MIPDPTHVAWVIFFVLLCAFVLNTLIFQPILRISEARRTAVSDAKTLAETAAAKAATASAEYEQTLGAARTEVYKQMDDTRRAALDRRAALVDATKREVESEMAGARDRVAADAAAARERLDREAGDLAGAIVNRVLGRPA